MNVLAIVQNMDHDDPFGGFIFDWMIALSKKVDRLVILTLKKNVEFYDVPNNVDIYSLGKEKYTGFSCKLYYLYNWHWNIKQILKKEKIDVVFTHMTPTYSVLAYPYFFRKKIPIVTWFLHPKLSAILKLAHYCSTKVVSATLTSYPYKKDKLVTIDHGINTKTFSYEETNNNKEKVILSVGRLSPIKDYITLLKAVSLGNKQFKLFIIGSPTNNKDKKYKEELLGIIRILNLEENVKILPAMTMKDLSYWYRQCSVLVNATPDGSFDKVVLEAMACKKLVLVTSNNFQEILDPYYNDLSFKFGNYNDLHDKLVSIFSLPLNKRDQITLYLQQKVIEKYSLDSLMGKLVEVFESVNSTNI